MLREWNGVRQIEGEGFRRWFSDQNFDLIVWFDGADEQKITGFQLCYDKQRKERALTWKKAEGYSHNRIDDGEIPFGTKRTPVLVADGAFARDEVKRMFLESAVELDQRLADFISERIAEYPSIAGAARLGESDKRHRRNRHTRGEGGKSDTPTL